MRIIIGILAVIIIIQAFIMDGNTSGRLRTSAASCRFLMEHDSNKLIQREIGYGGNR